MNKLTTAPIVIILSFMALPVQAAQIIVNASGFVYNVWDPDNLLPFDSLVLGQTTFSMSLTYDDSTAVIKPMPGVGFYPGAVSQMALVSGAQTFEIIAPGTISIANNFGAPGEALDAWGASGLVDE